MADAFIGEVRPFAFGWVPYNWLLCDGQTYNIYQYQALYAVIGAYYGGDGKTTFAVPNLMGYALMGSGTSIASGKTYQIPTKTGTETVTLNATQMANHTHTFNGATGGAPLRVSAPTDNTFYLTNYGYSTTPGGKISGVKAYVAPPIAPDTQLHPLSISIVGGGPNGLTVSHENRQPFLTIGYYISAMDGYFPPRP